MSDTPVPGWWQASDGKWYAPEQHPTYRQPTPQPPPPTGQPVSTAPVRPKPTPKPKKSKASNLDLQPMPRVMSSPRASTPPAAPPQPAPAQPLCHVKSRDEGKNADVYVWPDRVERVLERSALSISKAKQHAEVIPMRSISSVEAKKESALWTHVIVHASSNNIVFRLRHADADRMRQTITHLLLNPPGHTTQAHPHPTPTPSPAVSVADELQKLAALRDQGVLSPAEFDQQKARLLRQ